MNLFDVVAVLITLAALFSYINHRYIGLPTTISVMLIALLFSLGLIALGRMGFAFEHNAQALLREIDFSETLMHGMLSFLLFAGALHVNLADLARQKWVIGTLATGGVVLSTFIIGYSAWLILAWSGVDLPLPAGPERDVVLTMTYAVVVFSILVQGLTVERLIKRYSGNPVS